MGSRLRLWRSFIRNNTQGIDAQIASARSLLALETQLESPGPAFVIHFNSSHRFLLLRYLIVDPLRICLPSTGLGIFCMEKAHAIDM